MRPSRLVLLLAAAAATVGAGLATWAWSSDGGVAHAAPREGDRGTYAVTLGEGWGTPGSGFDLFTFQVGGLEALRTGDGRVHAVRVTSLDGNSTWDGGSWRPASYSLWTEDRAVLALGQVGEWSGEAGDRIGPLLHYNDTTQVRSMAYPAPGSTDCLLADLWSGASGWPDRVTMPRCAISFLGMAPYSTVDSGAPFELVHQGSVPVAGEAAEHYHGATPTLSLDAWYTAGTPYPVRMDVNETREDGNRSLRLELKGFQAGQKPFGEATVDPDPAPGLQAAPRAPWGLPEDGVRLPFPASEAFATALRTPSTGLADWLSAHPQAYPLSVDFESTRDVDGPQGTGYLTWRFTLSDGPTFYEIAVTRSDAYVQGQPHSLLPLVQPNPDGIVGPSSGPVSNPIDPAKVPADWPTLASLVGRWQAYTGGLVPVEDVQGWSVAVSCGDPCSRAHLELVLESDASTYTYDPLSDMPGGGDRDDRRSGLALDDTGQASGFALSRRISDQQFGPLASAAPAAPAPARPLPLDSAAKVAGVGLVAAGLLAAGLALAKWGPWALFSRIEGPRLADHPTRAAILAAVEAEPGQHFMGLQRRLGLSNGRLVHHLGKLVAAGLVVEHRSSGYTTYFPPGTARRAKAAAPVTRSPGAQRVLAALQAGPAGVREIARLAHVDPSTVHFHLHRMAEAGVVRRGDDGLWVAAS